MKNTISIKSFLKEKEIFFDSDKKEIEWVKRNLRPRTLIKIGPNYLVDSREMKELFENYLDRQEIVYKGKVERAQKIRDRKVRNSTLLEESES